MSGVFTPISDAIAAFSRGEMVIMVDDDDRENEGDIVIAAEKTTPESINFMLRHARGLICLAMTQSDADRLQLPLMIESKKNLSRYETAFTISIEAATGVTTGISAFDRARTVQVAVDTKSTANDLVSPGHIFPLRARDGGVLVRSGHTEGSVDLAKLAGLQPMSVLCEIMRDDGHMARLPDLIELSKTHSIPIIAINDLIAYRMANECLVEEVAHSRLPTLYGDFTIRVFHNRVNSDEHTVLQCGDIDSAKPILVRVHSACQTGDIFGSCRCDCGEQLQAALKKIGEDGGILLYMEQEGRGIGLANKIKAYELQDAGLDTVEANHRLGFSDDHRDYGIGSQILRYLGIRQMRLLTNNPRKLYGVTGYGLEVIERVPIEMEATKDNVNYLRTKQQKLGHLLALGEKNESH